MSWGRGGSLIAFGFVVVWLKKLKKKGKKLDCLVEFIL